MCLLPFLLGYAYEMQNSSAGDSDWAGGFATSRDGRRRERSHQEKNHSSERYVMKTVVDKRMIRAVG